MGNYKENVKRTSRFNDLARSVNTDTRDFTLTQITDTGEIKIGEMLKLQEKKGTISVRGRNCLHADNTESLARLRDAINVALFKLGYEDQKVNLNVTPEAPTDFEGEPDMNPDDVAEALYQKKTKTALYEECRGRNIDCTSKLKKSEYIDLLMADDMETKLYKEQYDNIPAEETDDWDNTGL